MVAELFKPVQPGRYPAVLFHHGSTGFGDDPTLFDRVVVSEAVARTFTRNGWQVIFVQRRGRGGSGGRYDEGFRDDRSAYSCEQMRALAGADRALEDLDVALAWVQQQSDVDASQLLSAGHSRGGVLALVHAAQQPDAFVGAINFVGGWLGEGCGDDAAVNDALFARAANNPANTLWIYAEFDPFYSVAYSRARHTAFMDRGGQGDFLVRRRDGERNGHFVHQDPALWADAVDAYLGQLP